MKAAPFEYIRPETVDEALGVLAERGDEAKVIAGGQSLLPMMALRLARPEALVDVGRITDLQGIDVSGTLSVGAGVTQSALLADPAARRAVPLLGALVPLIAHEAIRNRGTVGGSLAHADPAAELPALALLEEASFFVRSAAQERRVPATDFFVSYLTTAVAPDELLVRIELPTRPGRTGSAFAEVSRRHGDFALVGAGARLTLGVDGQVEDARLVFIGVASTAVRSPAAEAMLRGTTIADAAREAAHVAVASLDPPSDLHATSAYRRHVAGVLAEEVLLRAAEEAMS